MKNQLLKLIVCSLSLVFLAAVAHAYIPPAGGPGTPNSNTVGPLTTGATNEVKYGDATTTGGLSVGTFQARANSYFDQNVLFNSIIRGGTAAGTTNTPVTFGGPSNIVDAVFSGGMAINGVYQSDTLKTGGGTKPLCADPNGTLYICGATPPNGPLKKTPVYLTAEYKIDPNTNQEYVVALLSQAIDTDVPVDVAVVSPSYTNPNAIGSRILNYFTAEARLQNVCYAGSSNTPTKLVNSPVTVYAGTVSSEYNMGGAVLGRMYLPSGCTSSQVQLVITSYSPKKTSDGRDIIATQYFY